VTVRVYIGASSAELSRVAAAEEMLRVLIPGVEIVSTWPGDVVRLGDPNPRTASDEDRAAMAMGCIRQVERADIFWFLVPPIDTPTRGAWCEYDRALTHKIPCVASGDTKQSVFAALAVETQTDLLGARCVANGAAWIAGVLVNRAGQRLRPESQP
jgi:hypothetical protein